MWGHDCRLRKLPHHSLLNTIFPILSSNFAPISCKNNHFAPSRPTFPPENLSHLCFPFPRAWVVPGWGWVPVTVWCVFTIGGKGGHWLLTSPYTELVRHHLPPARNCDRPLLTGRIKTHTNTEHQNLGFLHFSKKIHHQNCWQIIIYDITVMAKLIAFSCNFPILLLFNLKTIYDIGILSNILIWRSISLLEMLVNDPFFFKETRSTLY